MIKATDSSIMALRSCCTEVARRQEGGRGELGGAGGEGGHAFEKGKVGGADGKEARKGDGGGQEGLRKSSAASCNFEESQGRGMPPHSSHLVYVQ